MQCFSFYAREVVENVGYVGFVKGYVTEKNRFLFSIPDLLSLRILKIITNEILEI